MQVKLNKDKIEIFFQYNPQLVSFVKSLNGRVYSPQNKSWFIPLIAINSEILRKLSNRGFFVENECYLKVKEQEVKAQELEAVAAMADTEFNVPLSNISLYPFQRVVSAFMVKAGSCLNACGVRTGKTIMTLAAVQKNGTKKNLIIAPGSVLYQWQEECNRVLPEYKTFLAVGTLKQRKEIYEQMRNCAEPFFLILSYDVARIDTDIIKEL